MHPGDLMVAAGVGERSGMDDCPQVRAFLGATVGSEGFLGPDIVTTGQYLGLHDGSGALVAVAGVHLAEKPNGVAVIGNVAMHPDDREIGRAHV